MLTDELNFDAISYVWGTAPASVPVQCNGATLYITPTAFEMLGYLYFFKPGPERPIWIDAICINQTDTDEKAVQVPLMSRIYSCAYRVVAWLGQATAASDSFLTEMRNLTEQVDADEDKQIALIRRATEPFCKGMAYILSSEWFTRLWTFQELALAKTPLLLCGKLWYNIDALLEFIGLWYRMDDLSGVRAHIGWEVLDAIGFVRVYREYKQPVQANGVPTLLHRTRLRQVGEPIDRIWALYGLLDKHMQCTLATLIDYSETSRRYYWLIFIACAKKIIRCSNNLNILDVPDSTILRPSGLPSWCPNLSRRADYFAAIRGDWNRSTSFYHPDEEPLFLTEHVLNAGLRDLAIIGHNKRYVSVLETNNVLHIRGFLVDTILEVVEDPRLIQAWAYIGDGHSVHGFSRDNPLHVAHMQLLSAGLDLFFRSRIENAEDGSDRLKDFLIAFWTDHRITAEARIAFRDAWRALRTCDLDRIFRLGEGRSKRAISAVSRFLQVTGHSFFSTIRGHFGLATPGCRPGDQVCVLYSGTPLYILRPHARNDIISEKSSQKRWDFVGTAYIPHLMDQHTNDDARQGPDQVFSLA